MQQSFLRPIFLLVLVLLGWGCGEDASDADGYTGRWERVALEQRASCSDDVAWEAAEPEEGPYFRLAPISIFGDEFLGYFSCSSADGSSCSDTARLGISYGRRGNQWYSTQGDLKTVDEGCEIWMKAGPLVLDGDTLSLVISHHRGVLDVPADECHSDTMDARYQELPCVEQMRWTAQRLP